MKRIPLFFVLAFCVMIALFSVGISAVAAQFQVPLMREDIVALTKPSVVRIAQHVKGTATIPALTINLKDWSVSVDTSRPSKTIPVDETLSGSGFIVSSDGYIVTNSHVVSLSTIKIDVMTQAVLPAMYDSALALNEEEANKIFQDESAAFEFSKKVFDYASVHSTFDVVQDIVVLDPSSQKERFDDLMQEGFPVQVVSVNDRFYDDDKDVALIKIDQEGLPTIPFGNSQSLNVGKQIFIFGFPATAEFNQRNPLESTFTQGVVSAIKDAEKKDFKVFQTDAKVSDGSSGGPLVDDNGNVLGIVTFQTGQFQKTSGDNFAFAIPIEMALKMIADSGVAISASPYQEEFKQGLGLLRAKHCRDALSLFKLSGVGNEAFDVDRYTAPYSAYCELLIVQGQSIDTLRSKIKDFAGLISPSMWMAIGIVALFGLSLCFVIWWLIREVNKEEREIQSLEKRLHEEEEQLCRDHKMIEKLSQRKKD
ncbi:MAG: trypsin-like peptidase domain-containing protein [Candidatus Moranbacteria bacterium]|nr:trypsin-like peptidase domain-containing protein [Candidatus Moranbacteria bacterium]